MNDTCATDINIRKLLIHFIGLFVVIAMAIFLSAGTIRWIAGWCFLILYFGFGIISTIWLFRYDPSLLQERLTGLKKPNREAWDKLLMWLWFILSLAWLILMPLDAVRFRWSQMPVWLQVVGAMILLASFYLIYLVFKENPYLSPAVRMQKERGQTVISTGPYRYVRHPLYAAFIPFFLGTAFLLGSWYCILLGLVLIGLIAVRAVMEERVPRKELQSYDAYMARVKYRFIPHVW